jgi:hypothetical protein
MRLARACLLLAATARALVPPARTTRLRASVPSVARRTTILRAEEANVGTAVRNIAPWLLFVLVGAAPRSNHFFRVNLDAIELSSAHRRPHTEPALRIPNYKECVAEKGHEACANLLPFFQWLYEHGIDVAA